MPFTVNVGPYQGGNFLFQGLSNLGQGIGGGITSASELLRKQKEDQGQADTIFSEYIKTEKFSDDETANKEMRANKQRMFNELSPSEKKGVAAGLIQNWLQKYHVEQIKNMQSEAATRELLAPAQKALAQAQATKAEQEATAAKAAAPYANTGIWTTDADGNPVQVGTYDPQGEPRYFPGRAIAAEKSGETVDSSKAKRVKDVATGEDLPFYAVPLGPKQSQILPLPDVPMRKDPATGLWQQWSGSKKSWETLPPQQQQQIRFFGPGGLANPEATPTPTPAAEEPAMQEVIRNLPTGQVSPGEMDAIAEKISKVKPGGKPAPSAAPNAKRDQAVAALQAKGYPTTEANIKALMDQIK
jgi:hypothetical protein